MEQRPVTVGPGPAPEDNGSTVRRGGWLRWDFLLCLSVAMLSALLSPLSDPDLPMHLRTGAWILEHGRVPLTEPFAWTRAGAPFYAYSWLPEVLYELAWRGGGASMLSVLHALLFGASVVSVWDLARVARWSLWATRIVLFLHIQLWLTAQSATRPQLLLALLLPVAWASAYRLGGRTDWRAKGPAIAMLAAANAVAVNSHLLFFLMLVPVVALVATPARRWQEVGAFLGATVAGWLVSPYLSSLHGVLSLNFAPNAMQGSSSPISEMEGGFGFLRQADLMSWLFAGCLLVLPLLPFFGTRPWRERWWYGLGWLAGLGLFGIAIRGFLMWWLLALPMLAWAVADIPLPTLSFTRRAAVTAWGVAIIGLLAQAIKSHRPFPPGIALPHPTALALEPAVRWLDCAVPASAATAHRAVTRFNYGSYLTWRLPGLSWSIDGRVIFPDSVALPEVGQFLSKGLPVAPPWQSADVVLLNAAHASLPTVVKDSAWQRIPLEVHDSASAVTLVVRRELAARGAMCDAR